MTRFRLTLQLLAGFLFVLSACGPKNQDSQTEFLSEIDPNEGQSSSPAIESPTETLSALTLIPTSTEGGVETDFVNDYADCGLGTLVEVPYYFHDTNNQLSPTQLIRIQTTDDLVREYVSLSTCLKFDEGWVSDPAFVENGYQNEIIFFDKYGKGHSYQIIIGGHFIAPYDSSHKDLTASINGYDDKYYEVQEWIDITASQFKLTDVRQIGLDIYITDNQGNLSKVLSQVYKFSDTNYQIQQALQSGEGYPDTVPEGFFLFATKAWLINPE